MYITTVYLANDLFSLSVNAFIPFQPEDSPALQLDDKAGTCGILVLTLPPSSDRMPFLTSVMFPDSPTFSVLLI